MGFHSLLRSINNSGNIDTHPWSVKPAAHIQRFQTHNTGVQCCEFESGYNTLYKVPILSIYCPVQYSQKEKKTEPVACLSSFCPTHVQTQRHRLKQTWSVVFLIPTKAGVCKYQSDVVCSKTQWCKVTFSLFFHF